MHTQPFLRLPCALRRSMFRVNRSSTRFHSTRSPPPNPRIQRLLSRLPTYLHPYIAPLVHAPVSHITTFLILHELTAVVPLVGLSTYFHYSGILPQSLVESENVKRGVEKFTRYFERKAWFGMSKDIQASEGKVLDGAHEVPVIRDENVEKRRREGTRIVMEVACAYALTKILLPVRLIISVWATPAVAGFGLRLAEGWRRNGKVGGMKGGAERSGTTTSEASTSNTGGIGTDNKAPPGENKEIFLLCAKLIGAAGLVFGFSRLFAKRPLMPEKKYRPEQRPNDEGQL